MEKSNTQSLREAIRAFLEESQLEKPLKERQLISSWESLLGKSIARATRDIYIKEGKLYVYLSSSVIRNELYMLQDEIIRKLNEAAGEELLSGMVLR
jgi:predicted nucleic acid-binding Zn ribbon protein